MYNISIEPFQNESNPLEIICVQVLCIALVLRMCALTADKGFSLKFLLDKTDLK